jgi:ABC-2 type transport system permease protein
VKGFYAALITEAIKAVKSKMLWITVLFFAFIALMMGLLMLVAKHPEIAENSAIISTKASLISKADWPTYLALLLQMVLVLGTLGSGIVTVWIFGREYSDRVIKDILVLPVSRYYIVLSKSIIIFVWSILLLLILFITGFLTGLLVKLDGWSSHHFYQSTVTFIITSLLAILLFTPVSLVTSISRGYLLPVGFIILMMIVTQLVGVGLPFIMPYFPWAIPALISGVAGEGNPEANVLSWIILIVTVLLGFAGTAAWWRYADQH